VGGRALQRSIGYAISRLREAQVRQLSQALDGYRRLSSAHPGTSVTAALAKSGMVSIRAPQVFEELVQAYRRLAASEGAFDPYESRLAKERVIVALGDHNGGPRDLLDVHVAAMDEFLSEPVGRVGSARVLEARLLALEMMGLLVEYYRVGLHTRLAPGGHA
jgi:hypothetical protein